MILYRVEVNDTMIIFILFYLPPYPTVPSHLSSSQREHPFSTASSEDPLLVMTDHAETDICMSLRTFSKLGSGGQMKTEDGLFKPLSRSFVKFS